MGGFGSIFWGFLFMFDFRIQGVDILPNTIGYLLMYSGLSKLSSYSVEFDIAKKCSLPLAVLSLFSLYQVQQPVGQLTIDPLSIGLSIVGIITTVLDLIMVYHLCLGIIELAKGQSNDELRDLAQRRWKYYLYVKVLFTVWFALGLIAPFILAVGFIPLFVLSIAILALMMALMKKSQNTFQY